MSGSHQQVVVEAQEHRQNVVMMRERLDAVNKELSQSSNHVTSLEDAIEAERASHLQTKFSCELFQVD